ncbi:hypothetical protein EMCRGX_G012680 [Ephydatia muelleri]
MNALILAAGYGTRLEQDLRGSEGYHQLLGVPKPLLPIGGRPLVSHWMSILQSCKEIRDIYMVVNDANIDAFQHTRLGAVVCIDLAVRHFGIAGDLLVIAGDTLFHEGFNLEQLISRFRRACSPADGGLVTYYTCRDEDTVKHGIIEIGDDGCVTQFLEKPHPNTTKSRNACPCVYVFTSTSLELIRHFLEEKKDAPLAERDAPGHFINYLYRKRRVHSFEVAGRFDVGGLQSYVECNDYFSTWKSK